MIIQIKNQLINLDLVYNITFEEWPFEHRDDKHELIKAYPPATYKLIIHYIGSPHPDEILFRYYDVGIEIFNERSTTNAEVYKSNAEQELIRFGEIFKAWMRTIIDVWAGNKEPKYLDLTYKP